MGLELSNAFVKDHKLPEFYVAERFWIYGFTFSRVWWGFYGPDSTSISKIYELNKLQLTRDCHDQSK